MSDDDSAHSGKNSRPRSVTPDATSRGAAALSPCNEGTAPNEQERGSVPSGDVAGDAQAQEPGAARASR